jgi:hypothetical protein
MVNQNCVSAYRAVVYMGGAFLPEIAHWRFRNVSADSVLNDMSATHVMQPISGKTLTGGVHEKLAHSRTDAAKLLGISANSLDRLTARGLLHPSRALRKPLYSTSELCRFLEATS